MSAPVTTWTEQENINPITYDDSATAYDDSTVFYNGYDPATDIDPLPSAWTDAT